MEPVAAMIPSSIIIYASGIQGNSCISFPLSGFSVERVFTNNRIFCIKVAAISTKLNGKKQVAYKKARGKFHGPFYYELKGVLIRQDDGTGVAALAGPFHFHIIVAVSRTSGRVAGSIQTESSGCGIGRGGMYHFT